MSLVSQLSAVQLSIPSCSIIPVEWGCGPQDYMLAASSSVTLDLSSSTSLSVHNIGTLFCERHFAPEPNGSSQSKLSKKEPGLQFHCGDFLARKRVAGVRWSWRYSFLGEVWLAAPGGPGRAICYAMPSGCQAWAT